MAEHAQGLGNPAVVGLAGFGMTTLMLQIHNLGWCEIGPIIALGFIFGGLAQLIAGYKEFQVNNNFGFSAFCSYGAFWIALALIFLFNRYGVFVTPERSLGWFLGCWGLYTLIMLYPAMRVSGAMGFTFLTLFLGFLGLTIGHFGFHVFNIIAAVILIVCALSAFYMMASAIYAQVFGRVILPLGKPWVK